MKKLLLTTLLLSGTFFIDIEARRAHQATQNNKIPAPQCAQVDINEERLKLTWDGWFWEHIGYPDQNRLAAQANIYKLLAEKALAQKAEIDRHNHVYQEWKNNVLTSIYGLKYPAIVAFLCFAYANSPKHDGTI
ncbi:hypothetical protein EBR77_02830 [bacterium]|nr:hypothetical protein [bacterium]